VALPADEAGALRHEALFKEAPQRDRQFARNRDDHDASDTPALPCSSPQKPAGDRTLWLVLEPEPGRLDYGPAHLASPGSRDSLGSLHVSAVVRTRCKAEKAGHLPPVVELAILGSPGFARAGKTDPPDSKGCGRLEAGLSYKIPGIGKKPAGLVISPLSALNSLNV
jgi:hypothetical protein